MTTIHNSVLLVMGTFYAAYFLKVALQRSQGVTTMVLGQGNKPENEKYVERWLKRITILMPAIELLSMYWNLMQLPETVQWIGVVVSALGVAFFCTAMITMQGNWRAGIPEKKETALVTSGIFRISRNPAFVGFDLLYLGILIAFPNAWHACCVAAAATALHFQIRNEEKYLLRTFGSEYLQYMQKVRRYL